ncbi:MAG: 3-dehydroquinate synthase [Omnitrophica WOR_2 bacterium]
MHVFLYGPPGSGKTTTGRLLAQQLNLPFVDLDEAIEKRAGSPIPEIFQVEGEAKFRALESAALEEAIAGKEQVIALGGGSLLDPANRKRAQAGGIVACLSAKYEVLSSRLVASGVARPLLQQDPAAGLQDLLAWRSSHYASFPLQVDASQQTPEQAAWQVQVSSGMFHIRGMGSGYDVRVEDGLIDRLGQEFLARGLKGPVALVSDENVGKYYADRALASLRSCGYTAQTVFIPSGELFKTLQTVSSLWQAFVHMNLERGSTVLALGGGVVGDLAGFAAAAYLRGIRWVAAPTTLLAMVDASLGGKTGADLPEGKNLIGAFHPPAWVAADPTLLSTLPAEELQSGMAEVVKHGVIADADLFDRCAHGWDAFRASPAELVRRAMAVKIQVIQEDPFEQGRRAVLNLGHTIGHALEKASRYSLRHGEAVAIGLVVEARIAERSGLAANGLAVEIASTLKTLGLPVEVPHALDREAFFQALSVDKKRAGGKVRFALPVRIGEVRAGVEVETGLVSGCLF